MTLNDMPLVSVVTATYQKFDRLFDTISSVLSQDYPKIEYIISDDGSDTFPNEKIQDYLSDHNTKEIGVSIISHECNIGTVKNLNEAYKASNGKYIINLSCGDVFFNYDVVSKIVSEFECRQCDVLVTSRLAYQGNFEPMYLLPHYGERRILEKKDSGFKQYKAFLSTGFFDMASGSAMSFSREIIKKMDYFDERYYLWEDGPFLAKYLQYGKLEMCYSIVSIWYETGGVSSKKTGNINARMKKDIVYFINNEKMNCLSGFNHFEKRLVQYWNRIALSDGSFFSKCAIRLQFFPEFLYSILYAVKRKNYKKKDRKIVFSIASGSPYYKY